jgi:hypothetical protein
VSFLCDRTILHEFIFLVSKLSENLGNKKIVHKQFESYTFISARQMFNSCMCCSHVVSSGVWILTQVHAHIIRVILFVTQFVNFYTKMLVSLDCTTWNYPALGFYNYLFHCHILWRVIEFCIGQNERVKDRLQFTQSYSLSCSGLCELSAKCRKHSMCKNLSCAMVLP